MAEQFVADVLICGAGASGLTLAIDLARGGISFRLIEKMDNPITLKEPFAMPRQICRIRPQADILGQMDTIHLLDKKSPQL